jgi:excisionase family DNA binding protein
MEPLLTVRETAAWLQVKPATLYTWAYRAQIPSQKVGKALRFCRPDIETWLRRQAKKAGRYDGRRRVHG